MAVPAATIAAGGQAAIGIGSLITSNLQQSSNRRLQKNQNEMDRLAQQQQFIRETIINRRNWNDQNSYNSPEQQMNRLRQAGLNPNLVYGKGADNTAQSISNASSNMPNQVAPKSEVDYEGHGRMLTNVLLNYFDTQQKVVQTDNLQKQADIMQAELRDKNFDYGQKLRSADTVFQHKVLDNKYVEQQIKNKQAEFDKVIADTQFTIDSNERAKIMSGANLEKITQEILESNKRILTMRIQNAKTMEETNNLRSQKIQIDKAIGSTMLDIKLKQFELIMKNKGVYPHDANYVRAYTQMLHEYVYRTYEKRHNLHQKGQSAPTR